MSQVKVYIAPFDNDGVYTDYQEVTSDVDSSIGSITRQLDNSEFDLGTFKTGDLSLKLRNEHGKYSDVGTIETMFRYKRSNSKVKITWEVEDDIVQCGFAVCGECFLSEEITIFEGLLSDESLLEGLDDRKVSLKVLSFESIFDKVIINTGDFSNGDSLESVLYDILNVDEVTSLLTISASNISLDSNINLDDKTELENETLSDALKSILTVGNAVLYIDANIVYIKPREASIELKSTFYGQGSDKGIESITKLGKINSGLKRCFNFWTWKDYVTSQQNVSSRAKYGSRKKEVGYDFITSSTSKDTVLTNSKDEFGSPKQELTLTTPLNYDTLELQLLDKINMDYPTPFFVAPGDVFPIFGSSVFGIARFPFGEWSLVLTETQHFKIMGIKIDLKNQNIDFKLREI